MDAFVPDPSPSTLLRCLADGTHVVADEQPGRLRVWVAPHVVGDREPQAEQVFVFEADVKDGVLDVFRLELWPLTGAPTSFPEWLLPVPPAGQPGGARVEGAVGRVIALITAAVAVESGLRANPAPGTTPPDAAGSRGEGFDTGEGTLLSVAPLGVVSVGSGGELLPASDPLKQIARTLGREPGALRKPIDASIGAVVARTVLALAEANAVLDAGGLLSGERYGGQRFLRLSGRALVLRPWQVESPATLIANPESYCDEDVWKLVDALPVTPMELPDSLRAVLPAVAAKLGRTREAAIDDLVAGLRRGGTVSGGPTTDQRWTLSFSRSAGKRGGFRIAGTNPEGERTDDAITEAEVRTMFGTYAMFGLQLPLP